MPLHTQLSIDSSRLESTRPLEKNRDAPRHLIYIDMKSSMHRENVRHIDFIINIISNTTQPKIIIINLLCTKKKKINVLILIKETGELLKLNCKVITIMIRPIF